MLRECSEVNVIKLRCYLGERPGLKLAFPAHAAERYSGIRSGYKVYVASPGPSSQPGSQEVPGQQPPGDWTESVN